MNVPVKLVLVTSLAVTVVAHAQRPARPLDTVRVAARSPDPALALTRTTEVIGRDELARRAGHDLADILSSSLGVDVYRRSPAQADLEIRGASFNQVVILVDGARVSDVQSGHYDLDLAVPVEAIERIEILRGGGSTLYGADAIGGVVNIVTRRAGENTLSVHGGTFGTAGGDVSVASVVGGTGTVLSADARRSDGHRDGTDYRAVQSRVGTTTSIAGGTLAVDAGVGVRDFGAADFYGAYPSYEDTRAATGAARFDRALSRTWMIDVSGDLRRHYDLYTLDRSDPSIYQNRHISWQQGARAAVTGRASRFGIAAGVEGLNASLESARLGDHDERRAAGFAELNVGSAGRTIAMVGSRLDWSSRTGNFFSPGASIATALAPRLRVRASASRGYRAPTWTEAYYSDPANAANPDLRSETFDMAEIGGRLTPRWGSLDVAVFARRGKDLIDWTKPASDPTALWRSTNLEAATFRGIEFDGTVASFAGVEWRGRVSGLRVTSADADTLVGKYALSPITESASIEATPPSYRGFRFTVNSGRARRAREEPYWRTDLRVTQVIRGWTLRLDGLNLTDADYRDASAKPVAGRMLLLGIGRR